MLARLVLIAALTATAHAEPIADDVELGALLLTLVAIPVIYTWFDDLSQLAHRAFARFRPMSAEAV